MQTDIRSVKELAETNGDSEPDFLTLLTTARVTFDYARNDQSIGKADPIVFERNLLGAAREYGINLEERLNTIAKGEEVEPTPKAMKIYNDAIAEVIPVIHKAFGTQPMDSDGFGLTDGQTMLNLAQYFKIRGTVKKNIDSPPSGSEGVVGPIAEQ